MFQGESTKIAISCELAALDTWPKQDHATIASRGRVVCIESAFFGKICSVNLPSWKLGKTIVRTFKKHWETRVKLVKPATVHWGKARGGGTLGSREALAGTTGRQGSTGSGLWVGWSLFERIRPRAKTQRIFAAFWLLKPQSSLNVWGWNWQHSTTSYALLKGAAATLVDPAWPKTGDA